MATIIKTPSIKDTYYVDFVNQLGASETISSVTVTAFNAFTFADQSSDIITTPAPAIEGTQVIFWYNGGVAGQRYVIAVKIVTSLSRNLEGDVDLIVQTEMPS